MMTIIHNNVDNDEFSLVLVKILLNNLRMENQVSLFYFVSFYDFHAILLSPSLGKKNCSFCFRKLHQFLSSLRRTH